MTHKYFEVPAFRYAATAAAGLLLGLSVNPIAQADGTETLGPASVFIASGSDISAAGTGMAVQPGLISISVPAGATVNQVLLYWSGEMTENVVGDNSINVGGTEVFGALIGGPAFFFSGTYETAYRADITSLDLVAPGSNNISVSGLDFSKISDGAGIVVIYEEPGDGAEIAIRDGIDLAYIDFPGDRQVTVAQTFDFTPSSTPRIGSLAMFFGSVVGDVSGLGAERPTSIEITTGGVTTVLSNLLASGDGDEWDTLNLDVTIPAGASSLTVHPYSRDDLATENTPASLSWIAAGLSVPNEVQQGGGEGCTPGYWKQSHHLGSWTGYEPGEDFEEVFGVDASFVKTLRGALRQGGGGEKALGRHAVAALLNSTSSGVDYLYTAAQVITMVQSAYSTGSFESIKNQLEEQNESGCKLGRNEGEDTSASEPKKSKATKNRGKNKGRGK
ncbi:hypothetical protein [Pseudohalioglobus lutimaris]|uniref:Uncharacterized protein n=1 Tax=Pseudohalioglobus lutimaris TaxID=1737061 RepID=A0A2N5WZH4_9GAMM|nr:hypothetical protein [Pseudohalioglobus lutimaris]PLW67632.1 hypothetical protein C0039_16150 [Pseudohalioglobus lutimaris]